MRNLKKYFLFLLGAGALLYVGSSFASEREPAAISTAQTTQRLNDLKQKLPSSQGEKRAEIIKKIAELENKIIETKRSNSSASDR